MLRKNFPGRKSLRRDAAELRARQRSNRSNAEQMDLVLFRHLERKLTGIFLRERNVLEGNQ